MPGFASTLAAVVEHVAKLLASASPYDVSMPSTLTREKHRAAAQRRLDGGETSQGRRGWPGDRGNCASEERGDRSHEQAMNRHCLSRSARGVGSFSNVSPTEPVGVGPTARSVLPIAVRRWELFCTRSHLLTLPTSRGRLGSVRLTLLRRQPCVGRPIRNSSGTRRRGRRSMKQMSTIQNGSAVILPGLANVTLS